MLEPLLGVQMAGARDCAPMCTVSKVKFEEDRQRWVRVAGAVQETCSSEMLGGPGADFLRGVAFLEDEIFKFAKMILRDRCSTT